MSKFKVGDRVVRNEGWVNFCSWEYGRDAVTIVSMRDEGQTLCFGGIPHEWDADRFDLFDPKEAANDIAPLSLIQYHVPLILQWGRDRGILDNSTPLGQSRKTVEETFELVEAAAQLVVADARCDEDGSLYASDLRRETLDKLADAIGDIFVTLVMVAGCAKLDINACVAQAYETIKDRKGKMNDKGVWVKEEEQV